MDIFDNVNVATAECFDTNAEVTIRANINEKFGSEAALTKTLQLLLAKLVMSLVRRGRTRVDRAPT